MNAVQSVLMTADTVGGVWTYAIDLCQALGKYGLSISLATMGAPVSPAQRDQLLRLRNVELHEGTWRLEWMEDPWDDVRRAGEWLLELESRTGPDLIHLNAYSAGTLPFAVPKLVVGHSCVCSWWLAVHRQLAPPSWDTYRRVVRAGLESADQVVAPSGAMLAALRQHYGLAGGLVIRNARDSSRFRPASKQEFIFAAGRVWDPAKNLAVLARAAQGLPWPVHIAGPTTSPDSESLAIEGVDLLGTLSPDDVAGWLGRASIYALPARYEPFGLSILEAAMSGCALVLGDIPSLRELWEGAAMFVAPEDPEALHAVLRQLIGDSPHRTRLALAAQRRAADFSIAKTAEAYRELYTQMVASQEARCAS